MPSFSIALSGLQADSVALNTIGNNLANLNTTAFKRQDTTFEDLFYQQIGTTGANESMQVGAGTKVSGTSTDFTSGSLPSTGKSTDMALAGDGFFVVEKNGVQSLTRAGNFQLDSFGNLETVNGEQVMGYGIVNGTATGNTALGALQLPIGQTEQAQPTQNFSVTANLNAAADKGSSYQTPITLYDSLGQKHLATVNYTKTSDNTWSYSVVLPDGEAGTTTGNTGTLTFDSSGNLVSPTSVTGISFSGLSDGASDMNLNWEIAGGSLGGKLSQTTAASSNTAAPQDGFASGVYQSFSVDPTGVITATFSNQHTVAIGQVAVASVANQEGLVQTGNNDYRTTAASGDAIIGVAGTGGRATIQDQALEQSNVDISVEFSDLIVAQRAFQANSKTVTTFDQITQDTIGMLR
ncbi:flagellar hook protein FlgE [Granulicella sp. dw_53]|uniref:flagellar hook protein FlgE n=1 Tax=Granulicella sp. dw_53 TaxID=2719792 RepID=UPI001BD555EF|nr:flagellar hook protein FlgE [Granulicella sp. dw_53]